MKFLFESAPSDLVSILKDYPKIYSLIELDWGTTRLDKFLLDLLADSFRDDGKKRQGFPLEVFDALTKLQLANLELLKSKGILEDEDDDLNSRFGLDTWDLPKNF